MQEDRRLITRDGPWHFRVTNDTLVQKGITNVDSVNVVSIAIDSWVCLLADSPISKLGNLKPRRVFRRWLDELTSRPLKVTIAKFTNFANIIMSNTMMIDGNPSTGTFIPDMKDTPIFKEYLSWYRSGDPKLLRYILTFCLFLKKIDYVDESLYATALRGWLDTEIRIGQISNPGWVKRLRVVLGYLLKVRSPIAPATIPRNYAVRTFDNVIPFMGRHGPGSTAERKRSTVDKNALLAYHGRLDRGFFTGSLSSDFRVEIAHDPRHVLPDGDAWVAARIDSNRLTSTDVARLKFVPKTTKTARSICMEPVSFQFFQQAYRWELEERISHSLSGRFITLEDQSRNQRLARYGSRTGKLDTIDLSAASDSVRKDLVKEIFPRRVLYKLLATRTSKVLLPTGETYNVKKFAPMGSALCFPIQSLIFLGTTILAHLLEMYSMDWSRVDETLSTYYGLQDFIDYHINSTSHIQSMDMSKKSYLSPSVYGDDIICDSKVTRILVNLLTDLGFLINEDKSFTSDQLIRESCGEYYWGDSRVTPYFLRVKVFKTWDTQAFASCVAAINNAGDNKLFNVRRALIRTLRGCKAWYSKYIGFTSNPDSGDMIYSRTPGNRHLRKRYNEGLQRFEVEVTRVVGNHHHLTAKSKLTTGVRNNKSPGFATLSTEAKLREDSYRLQRYWQVATLRRERPAFDLGLQEVTSPGSRVARRWTPCN